MTDRQRQPDWEKLATYFAGEARTPDAEDIEAWAGESDSHSQRLEQLRQIWMEAGPLSRARQSVDTEAGWARMHARLRAQHEASERPAQLQSLKSVNTRGWRKSSARHSRQAAVAAAFLIVASGVVLWKEAGMPTTPGASRSVQMREYAASRGQRANIRLADGTQVVLGPDSKLRVPQNIGDAPPNDQGIHTREVTLEGTAYFSVVHDEDRPFVVRTSAGFARDLGTEFQVRAYEEMHGMEVTVVSGLVSLARTTDNTSLARLQKGDRATLSNGGGINVTHSVDLGAATALAEGRLVFDGTPLREVAIALSRWYDLDVQLADNSIATRHLALTLEDETPEVVLNMIALSLDLRVERKDQTVRLYPRSQQNR